jgi:hypothetical protein
MPSGNKWELLLHFCKEKRERKPGKEGARETEKEGERGKKRPF